ncbi:hypothetical protein KI688_000741 [Linnemannia hyalina]|uniref:F-box domain-containing protein n=1 Tax=Linnemannia hyalina TaxID=64524 RepID=A0A9P7Y4W7_9FUNG|nr:hypothetical protein KI688_000741 [Linnemannia hyalina]
MIRYLHRRLHKTSPASTTIVQTKISPLDIPEILDLIFSFLNDYTLRRSVLRVSRQWHLLSQTRLSREVIWSEHSRPSKKERALRTLPGASKVHFSFHSITPAAFKTVRDALLHLEDEVESGGKQQHRRRLGTNALDCDTNNYNMTQTTPTSTPTVYSFTPLREMELFVWYSHTDSFEWFPLPSSLVSLRIGFSYAHYTTIDLQGILEKCPALERLCIESHGSPVILSDAAPRLKSTIKDASQLPPLSLRSLVLCGIGFAQEDLETLLLLTPNLKELQLRSMLWSNALDKYEWARLFQLLKRRNITLDKAHFSMAGSAMSVEETEMLLTGVYRPSSQERFLWALDLTPQLLQSVFSMADTLTTLEILWKPTSKEYPRECCERSLLNTHALIHKLLCESPRLVHLTTLKTMVRLQDIDLFDRAGYTDLDTRHDATVAENVQSSSSTSRPPPAIWRCRSLRTLHIDLHIPLTTEERPVYSRIVFGYVSRVCPLLEDLQIGTQETCHSWVGPIYYFRYFSGLSMSLGGGLCLLGRLKFLQRLRVFSDVGDGKNEYKDWDVNWITASGRKSVLSNWKRRREVKSWREWRRNEDLVETVRAEIRMRLAISGTSHPIPDADAVILKQLENLGLLFDVEEMVKEMEVKEFRPMPALEGLSLNHPTLMPPETVLEHLFPSMLDKLRSR